MSSGPDLIIAGFAAVAAGMINALAGGGTLITFPVLVALGMPAVAANVTNTVALCPGYLGGSFAQRKDLTDQKQRLWLLIPVSILGGIAGGLLLLQTEERLFKEVVPFLILLAAGLLAINDPVRRWIMRRNQLHSMMIPQKIWAILFLAPAAVYGGYFGAGVSVIVLAVLGLFLEDSITRLNALKQVISFTINVAAAIFFLFSGQVAWLVALVMAAGALTGGVIGGKLAGKINPALLRWIVVVIGVVVAVVYFIH